MKLYFWGFWVFLCILNSTLLKSQDSVYVYTTILIITDFNDDHSLDTLIGQSTYDLKFFPKMIVWGKDSTVHPDPNIYPKVPTTTFNYSQWERMRINYMVGKFNRDTISDIIFISSGKLRIDSVTTKDTATALILFGQCGLDTIAEMNLYMIAPNQIFPYKARHLFHGDDFKNCTLRGEPYRTFYELPKIDDVLLPPPPGKHACVGCTDKLKIAATIYPVPSENNINIIFEGLEPGDYLVNIIDLSGSLIMEKSIKVNQEYHQENLSFKDAVNGTYMMMLVKAGKTIYSQKFLLSK
jgi:hypothetical protein